jgi:pimeloyl-ACP methyl ester carboxylesterase
VSTPHPENNRVNARWFPAPKPGKRAVVVLPHWNADGISYNGLCVLLNKIGISALRLSLPYHDARMPPEIRRADYAVSANVGRTITAARQGVCDVRACLDWLEQQGYSEFGILGTSLGSAVAFLAAAHEPRLRAVAFNHASSYFADVVWRGQSTRHIREGLEREITLERLRPLWMCISPMAYFDQYARFRERRSLTLYAKYDLTFPPDLSRQVVSEFARRQVAGKTVVLPCGHYTTGESPFKYMDGWHLVTFLRSAFRALEA